MAGSIAEELYSESLRLSREKLDVNSAASNKQSGSKDCNADDLWDDSDTLWDNSSEELHQASDLDREWQKRRVQFHTIGFRDGVIAGKEASAQVGFNIGFKESVLGGYKWGLVRGVTSALALLPDGMKEKLVETQEKGNKLQSLHEAVHSLSTTDALKLFYDSIQTDKTAEQGENVESGSNMASLQDQSSECSLLGSYYGELHLLLRESPKIEVSLAIDH